ncbi:cytochrome c oxidase subunit II [Thiohalomonas denitrificans]|uniref:Uncharacterized protein n=1 Tax=Thiohalomonas denitrificans TaxID=415747 RepID=A0A1G5PWZ6_9GAMM|nr:hypothetical protein [Thiohalomonas denitrificans]SCZ53559.1 hypothetical protein SAMN03097708_00953 [Thiohalomonas denitrificans]
MRQEVTRPFHDLYLLTLGFTTALMIVVTLMIGYSVWRHQSKSVSGKETFHKSAFVGWIGVPVLVLGIQFYIAGASQPSPERIGVIPDRGAPLITE